MTNSNSNLLPRLAEDESSGSDLLPRPAEDDSSSSDLLPRPTESLSDLGSKSDSDLLPRPGPGPLSSDSDLLPRPSKHFQICEASSDLDDAYQESNEDSDNGSDFIPPLPSRPLAVIQSEHERASPGDPINQPITGLERYICDNPTLWVSALAEIRTLAPRQWLGASIGEIYAFALSIRTRDRLVRYVPFDFSQSIREPEEAERHTFHNMYDGDLNPSLPVVFIRHAQQHFYVVAFDYPNRRSVTFGRIIDGTRPIVGEDRWEEWDGPWLWNSIASLHGMTELLAPLVYEAVNWKQNGYDCGVDATVMLEHLLEHGLPSSEALQEPVRQCAHLTRQHMLNGVCQMVQMARQWHNLVHDEPLDLDEEFAKIFTEGWDQWPALQEVGDALTRAHTQCIACQRSTAAVLALDSLGDPRNSSNNSSSEELLSPNDDLGPLQGVLPPVSKRFHAGSSRMAYQTTTYTIPLVVPPLRPLVTAHRVGPRLFDDYMDGPVQEDNVRIPIKILNLPDNPYAQRLHSSTWTMFRDYGFRLEPSFYQLFNKEGPISLLDHLLSIPPDIQQEAIAPHSIGLQDLLTLAEADPLNTILCGKEGDKLLHVDPRHDRVTPAAIQVSLDIDSVIWVTHQLKFKLSTKLRMGSIHMREAPIARNNHVYISLLQPRSEADRELHGGHRQEWESSRHSVSSLPHMPFIQCGEGSGSFNAHIFFPRMKHKSEYGFRSVSIIPTVVQDLFYAQVLLPALKAVAHTSSQSYLVQSLKKLKWMMSDTSRMVTFPLDPHQVVQLQIEMRRVIEDDPDLALFGSFFFVLDARGIKLWTVDGANIAADPMTALRQQSSALDWEYMLDRQHGELLLDLGIGFHPMHGAEEEDNDGFVGLWELNFLKHSYAMAGLHTPVIHRSATLQHVGNMQAEMTSGRSRATHIAFRQSYNLAFEVIRRTKGDYFICRDSTAYHGGTRFVQAVDQVISELKEASGRSFGVREEIRIGGAALSEVLPAIRAKAESYLQAQPILWIPSSTWFRFLKLRMQTMRDAQVTMSQAPAANHGIITAIMMHLLRSTLVNPQRIPGFLNDNLRAVRFQEVIGNFGLFFLHNLQAEASYISDIDVGDDENIHAFMGVTKTKGKRKGKATGHSGDNVASLDFPLGPRPTWGEVVDFLAIKAEFFLKPQVFPAQSVHHQAGQLFVEFTAHVWFVLADKWFADPDGPHPSPHTVKDAITCWSYASIYSTLDEVQPLGSKAGLIGATGNVGLTFRARRKVFFPFEDPWTPCTSSPWYPLMTSGYIQEAFAIWSSSPKRLQNELVAALDQLFEQLQCLPVAAKGKDGGRGSLWSVTPGGAVEVVCNSSYYRLVELRSETNAFNPRRKRATGPNWTTDAGIYHRKEGISLNAARALFNPKQLRKANHRKKQRQLSPIQRPIKRGRGRDSGSQSSDEAPPSKTSKASKKAAVKKRRRGYSSRSSSSYEASDSDVSSGTEETEDD